MSNQQSSDDAADKTVIAGATEEIPKEGPAPDKPKKPAKKKGTQQIGDFKIIKKLGQGGMGAVYKAHQVSLDRPCALKVMSSQLGQRKDFVDRFIREARVGAKIEHPNVVKCYAVGDHKGIYYAALEFIDGKSMQDWIDELKTLSVGDAVHVAIVCGQALGHAHNMNLIHRDIKPDNILGTKDGMVKVADLGLAKAVDEDQSMTQSGTGLGTPLYMPPEQARNAKYVDRRSDVYALGCTLYRFLTGVPPYKADSTMELIIQKEKGKHKPAAKINKEVPERLDLIIDKCMAKDPQHRYQTCEELVQDLEKLQIANDSLSFIQSENKASLSTGAGGGPRSSIMMSPAASNVQSKVRLPKTSREEAREAKIEQAKLAKGTWYVRFKDRSGKETVKRMKTDQIHRGLATKLLDETAQLTKDPKLQMMPIGAVKEFKDQVQEILFEKREGKKKKEMKSIYGKLDRQHKRRKFWRILDNLKSGTLGWISLVIWLGVVGIALYFAYLYIPVGYKMAAEYFGLTQ